MKNRLAPYIENVTEAGCACLVTMVQGNVLSLGIAHWIIASQTGLIAGAIAGTTMLITGFRRQWLISVMLGVITAVVDFCVHPETLGIMSIGNALITGLAAATLSYLASLFFTYWSRPAY